MSVSSLTTLLQKLSDSKKDIEDVGHFTALNLSYDSSNYEAKRHAEHLVRELNAEIQSYEEMFGNDDNEEINFRADLDYKRRLLQKIQCAAKILTNEDTRSSYMHEIKARCYLSQAFTLSELKDRYSGRVFPFFTFEVYRKNGGIFKDGHHRFLCLNFIEMIVEEKKDNQLLRGFNCSSIKQIMPGFNMDEIYLSIDNGDESFTHHYQVKYWQQRDLLIELITFSKYAAQRRTAIKSEKMQNPNISLKDFDKSSDDIVNLLGANVNASSTAKTLRILSNDSVIPHKHLFQCQVYRKRNSLFDKRVWMAVGTSNIIISHDQAMKSVVQIFPIAKDSASFIKISDKGDFSIIINENKNCFRACKASDAETILNLGVEMTKGAYEHEQVITSFPYNKKDSNVSTILFKKLNQLNQRISETKKSLMSLRAQRSEIKKMLLREKCKNRPETIWSMESKSIVFSKTSISNSNDDNFLKSQLSLYTLDEREESSGFPSSITSLSLSPFRRGKTRALSEIVESPYARKKEKEQNETLNSIDSFQDLNITTKGKTHSKSIGSKGKISYRRQGSRQASIVNSISQESPGNPQVRRLARFMSARYHPNLERVSVDRPAPMSMKDVGRDGDETFNKSPEFARQALSNIDEDESMRQDSAERVVRNGRSESEISERKRQKLDEWNNKCNISRTLFG